MFKEDSSQFKSHIKNKEIPKHNYNPKINRLPVNYKEKQNNITQEMKLMETSKNIDKNLKGILFF